MFYYVYVYLFLDIKIIFDERLLFLIKKGKRNLKLRIIYKVKNLN